MFGACNSMRLTERSKNFGLISRGMNVRAQTAS